MKEELLKATITDKKEPTDAEVEALDEALKEELELLGEKADPNNSVTETFMALNIKMDQLVKRMKESPPDAMGHYMQFRELQKNYLDRLSFAVQAQQILEMGEGGIFEKVRKYKSDTEIWKWDLQSKNSYTTCPQLDENTLSQTFSYEGLVNDKDAGAGTRYMAPPSMTDLMTNAKDKIWPAINDCEEDINDCEEDIKRLNKEEPGKPEDRKQRDKDLRKARRNLKNFKDIQKNLQKQKAAMQAAFDTSAAAAVESEKMARAMNQALDKSREAFAEFQNKQTTLKAAWNAGDSNKGSSFETKVCTKTFSMQKSQSQTEAQIDSVDVAANVGGGWGGFGVEASAGVAHQGQQAQMTGEDQTEEHVFHFECEGCFGTLDNPLLKTVLKGFRSDQWFIEGKEPGYFWKSNGNNVRFYVAEIFVARKLMFKTSHSEASNHISATTGKTTNSANWSAQASGWGATGGTSGQVSHSNQHQGEIGSMKKNAKDDAFFHGGWYIKFYLLKPFIPAPKRGNKESCEWNTPEYAKEHLGVIAK